MLLLNAVIMVVEVAAGLAFGSIALLADGLHMGLHATALGINAYASHSRLPWRGRESCGLSRWRRR